MIDNNVILFSKVLIFHTDDDCYHIQVLKRRKDNPDQNVDVITIDNFLIYNVEDFKKKYPQIIDICNKNNARAYVRPNKRSIKKTAFIANDLLADYLLSENYKAVKNVYWTAIGDKRSISKCQTKVWVIDVDDVYGQCGYTLTLREMIEDCFNPDTTNQIITSVPTVNGFHLITNGFDLKKFTDKYNPSVSVHKDSLTLLYAP